MTAPPDFLGAPAEVDNNNKESTIMATNINPLTDVEDELVELGRAAHVVAMLERHFLASGRPTLWNGLLDAAHGRVGRGPRGCESTADRIEIGDGLLAALERLSERVRGDVLEWREEVARPVRFDVDHGDEVPDDDAR